MMLSLQGLTVGYNGRPVLSDATVELAQGEIVALVGANGAGKSSLVKGISGLLSPLAGRILFEGRPIQALPPSERLRLGIVHVPEGRQVFAAMTVADNLRLGGNIRDPRQLAGRIAEMGELFPVLGDRMGDTVGNFSGGQQQMVAIARGLMSSPRLILLDEPSLGLSPLLVGEVFRLIRSLRDRGLTVLLAEQNARSALAISDRGYVLENGRISLSGPAANLLASPEIAERYLGGRGAAHAGSDVTANLADLLRGCIGPM